MCQHLVTSLQVTSLLVTGLMAAPPQLFTVKTTESPQQMATDLVTALEDIVEVTTTLSVGKEDPVTDASTTIPPSTPSPDPIIPTTTPPHLSGKEREALISHLGQVDLSTTDKLILTPKQQLAITQELEYRKLGLQPFQDPSPWQRLTKEEQMTFNKKYLALPSEVQEFARVQFTSIPEDIQEHAFNMFLTLDMETLVAVISRELEKEREELGLQQRQLAENQELKLQAEEAESQRQEEIRRQFESQRQVEVRRQLESQRQLLAENPRSQQGVKPVRRRKPVSRVSGLRRSDEGIRRRPRIDPRRQQ